MDSNVSKSSQNPKAETLAYLCEKVERDRCNRRARREERQLDILVDDDGSMAPNLFGVDLLLLGFGAGLGIGAAALLIAVHCGRVAIAILTTVMRITRKKGPNRNKVALYIMYLAHRALTAWLSISEHS